MAKIFLTGSSDGIGLAAARLLAAQGHKVTLHARSSARAEQAREAVPNAAGVLIGDLSSIEQTKKLAEEANKAGPWDAVIHNAGVYRNDSRTEQGLAMAFAVNCLAPYMLTCLMEKPKRLLYMSSSLHYNGDTSLNDVAWTQRKQISVSQAYSDSKLQDVLLANAVARRWPDVQSCSMDPGWVQTKMGGFSAPVKVDVPAKTLASYAAGDHVIGTASGVYFTTGGAKDPNCQDLSCRHRAALLVERVSALEERRQAWVAQPARSGNPYELCSSSSKARVEADTAV
ncbi:hypothetical protein AMS68_006198 [Peltaster fructicola]|uniref:Uncharacterized protein n=1 Tax=Peltaster fructicola TaxID=286661 RepID=A0A6H0Y186_9PEZI|nr:hypothetical protein AMS68_006198 [Peltaster fructicola]